jgi:3-oxoacyl-[acyl-carrier-protein] synthase II
VAPERIGYLNAHATGTPVGDVIECRAIREVFGDRPPLVSSTKAATGHLLGAAGALEAAYVILALGRGVVPPTLGLESGAAPSDCAEFGLDLVPQTAREVELEAVMSNSFAFGGHNASLVFTRFRE